MSSKKITRPVPKAPFELEGQMCKIYLLLDKFRNIYINPLPIDTEENAIYLFGQLLETKDTYAYKGYDRFDLYRLGSYQFKSGKFSQKNGRPSLVVRGTHYKKDC